MKQLRRSDHAAFWSCNLTGMMTTDSSNFRNPNHHCLKGTNDGVETLDHAFSTKASKATLASADVGISVACSQSGSENC